MPTDWIFRVGDGKNFKNSSKYLTWGINSLHSKSFMKTVKKDDRLWYVISKNNGKLIGVSTYSSHNKREIGITRTSEELGWSGEGTDWTSDVEIHYTELYELDKFQLFTHIIGPVTIRKCNEKCKVNLSLEYLSIVRHYNMEVTTLNELNQLNPIHIFIAPSRFTFDFRDDLSDNVMVAKVPKKVSLKKVEPVVEREVMSVVIETIVPAFVPVLALPVIVETVFTFPVVQEIQSTPVEVEVPVVESEQEIFRRLSREKRQAKLAKLTAAELAEKKRIACEKNAAYREKNPDKIKAKDNTYYAKNKEERKEKRDEKLKDPIEREKYNKQQREIKAKKRAEVKATAEPKPKKEKKLTNVQKKDAIMGNPALTLEQKLELMLALFN